MFRSKNRRHFAFLAAIAAGALSASPQSRAQVVVVPPFNSNGVATFDPVIDTVQSGALLDAQATVSADRKYVTLTMRPQLSTVIAFFTFQFQGDPNQAFVGNPLPANGAANGGAVGGANSGTNIGAAKPKHRPLSTHATPAVGGGGGGGVQPAFQPGMPVLTEPLRENPLARTGMTRIE